MVIKIKMMDPSGLSPTVVATAAAAEFEPEASRVQGGRSTVELRAHQDKYEGAKKRRCLFFPGIGKKEVIQPQVPLRLPCDDLTHLTELRFTVDKGSNVYLNPARLV